MLNLIYKYKDKAKYLFYIFCIGFIIIICLKSINIIKRMHFKPQFVKPVETKIINEIKGARFIHYIKDKKVIAIKTKDASIKKKKVGFFRIGGLKQLELTDMELDYYDFEKTNLQNDSVQQNFISCLTSASKKFNIFQEKLAGFVAYNALIRYFHIDKTMTFIHGPYMELDKNQKSLLFNGNTVIHYLDKILICKDIVFDTKSLILSSNNKYTFIQKNKNIRGKGFLTDLKLNILKANN